MREVACMGATVVAVCEVKFADGATPDLRNYIVRCDKIRAVLPEFQPTWTVRKGVEELLAAYRRVGLGLDDFVSSRYLRIKHVRELQESGKLDENLRLVQDSATA